MSDEQMVIELLVIFLVSGSMTGVVYCIMLLLRTHHAHHTRQRRTRQSPHDKRHRG